jgi:uncharacterized protein (DUF433 family)
MLGNSRVVVQLQASQEGLSSMELVMPYSYCTFENIFFCIQKISEKLKQVFQRQK